MNLEYKEILKLKGTYLVDKRHDNNLCYVESATRKNVKINQGRFGLSTTMTEIFMDKYQQHFEKATDKQVEEVMTERLENWFEQYGQMIRGFYIAHGFEKNGGWNGTMDAMNMVEEQHPHHVDFEYLPDGFLEKMVKEYV